MEKYANEVEAVEALNKKYLNLKAEVNKIIIGQDEVVRLVITSLFCHSHSLLIGVPGLAKTLLIKTLASALNLDFNRIQFTPDLMPSDILGAETLDKERNFKFIKGPIFNNIVLADEINRTPPKTQAALLEAMQERNVTIAGERFELPDPFFVLATQNPIEQEGTYPLPEAQLDRFMFSINLDYPSFEQELDIVKKSADQHKVQIDPVISSEEITYFQKLVDQVPVNDAVVEYAVKLVHLGRPKSDFAAPITKDFIDWGAGPRASQFLIKGARCNAILNGKFSPDIEDVQAVATPVLRHRLLKNFKADAEGVGIDEIIHKLMQEAEGS